MVESVSYVPGLPPANPEPLSRFLPPIPDSVASRWLRSNYKGLHNVDQGWILDPFGMSPRLAVEIAKAGYRLLVAANNPIARFLIELAANPPRELQLKAVLAELATARKGDDRLEPHIRSLYSTECNQCGNIVEAEAFIWEKRSAEGRLEHAGEQHIPIDKVENKLFQSVTPVMKLYKCGHCGASGEFPTNHSDHMRASQFSSSRLHYARALERIASPDDPERPYAEEALFTYLPRSIYALFTLMNKAEGLGLRPEQYKILNALLLTTFDQINTLWPHPSGRARPRSLIIPPRFRELNAWMALEESISTWASKEEETPLSIWPENLNSSNGICIFEGRLKDLVETLRNHKFSAVVTTLPRPNQAFWTLSALWSGWLWGREAIGPFKHVLRRRRYDWSWHATALHSALAILFSHIDTDVKCLSLICESEPGFLSAALIAGAAAGFGLSGIALRAEIGQAQITWVHGQNPYKSELDAEQASIINKAAKEFLKEKGEPSNYIYIHTAAIQKLYMENRLVDGTKTPAENLGQLNKIIDEVFSSNKDFIRIHGSDKSLEVGQWWLQDSPAITSPISDRIEQKVFSLFLDEPFSTSYSLEDALCRMFPGLITPNIELFQICLDSYAEEYPPKSGRWHLRSEDEPENRRIEVAQIKDTLINLGNNLGYTVIGNDPILALDSGGNVILAWYVITSAVISNILHTSKYPPLKSLIVLPGSRANLVAYKIQKDPRLQYQIDQGWRFVKFRLIRWIANNPILNLELLEEHVAQEKLTYESPQLRMF